MAHCSRIAAILSLLVASTSVLAEDQVVLQWDWNSGTTEGWYGLDGDTQLSIEAGRNGTTGLGAVNGPPYVVAQFPILEIQNQSIVPGHLVGFEFGNNLPLTGEISVDTSRTLDGAGNYVRVWIYNEFGSASFVSYPADGKGSIESLGDGWFRHHLVNLAYVDFPIGPASGPLSNIRLEWNFNFDASTVPIVFDNLRIVGVVPEPNSLWPLLLVSLFIYSSRFPGVAIDRGFLSRSRR